MSLLCCVGAILLSGQLYEQADDCHRLCEGTAACEHYGWDVTTQKCYACSAIEHDGVATVGMVCGTQDASMTASVDTKGKRIRCDNVKGSYCIICPNLFSVNASTIVYELVTGTWVDAIYISGHCTRIGVSPTTVADASVFTNVSFWYQFDARTSHVNDMLIDGGGWQFHDNVTIDIMRGGITVRNIGLGINGVIRVHEAYNKRMRQARGFMRNPSQKSGITEMLESILIQGVQSRSLKWPIVQVYCNAPSRPTRLADLQIQNSRSDGGLVAAIGGMVTGHINLACEPNKVSVATVLRRIPYGHVTADIHDELVIHDVTGRCDVYDVSSEFSFWSYDYTVRDESSNGRLFTKATHVPVWLYAARTWLFVIFVFMVVVCIVTFGSAYAWIEGHKKTEKVE